MGIQYGGPFNSRRSGEPSKPFPIITLEISVVVLLRKKINA